MKRYIIFDFDATLLNSEDILDREIYSLIQSYKPEYLDTYLYIWNSYNGRPYVDIVHAIFKDPQDRLYIENQIQEIIKKNENTFWFFPWVPEIVEELSKNYMLFISSGGYTEYITPLLKKVWIDRFFAHVQGSEIIPKSKQHIEIFKEITQDPDFENFALSIGDGLREKEVAKECGIDFIQIGKPWSHEYEISGVSELIDYLHRFSNTSSIEITQQNYML